ncbi:MAG: DUF1501 domain-containing protein [Planctomycetes bacterium]|nr:DUF1501 domain-containing protein [Planctomycetota bacterium]
MDLQHAPLSRRQLLSSAGGVGMAALASLLGREASGASPKLVGSGQDRTGGLPGVPHFAPKAKRVIYLFQSGAPSQLDLFDYKPSLKNLRKSELPDSIRMGQRLTAMTATQASFPVAPTIFNFDRRGESGAWVSDLLPYTAGIADKLCFIRTMNTEAINHDPAITFFQTGAQLAGRPSMGSWLAYGLGSQNEDLPTFVTMVSGRGGQPLYDRLWGSGFLPSKFQGVKFRSVGDPVLYLSNPKGLDGKARRRILDDLAHLNQLRFNVSGDPEITTRIAQYEMAYRMQTSVPELTDLSSEPKHVIDAYGPEAETPGTFAANCLLARRLAERGVRFIQLFHRGWDQHGGLPKAIARQCSDTDQPSAALVLDLEQRGLLKDTLVVWGGEFGRTVYCQGKLTKEDYGRDHHPRCFTIWLAGAGIKSGVTYGETDDYGYNIVKDPVHIHNLHATMLHCLGIDHKRLTFQFQGRHHRLTDVHGELIEPIMA